MTLRQIHPALQEFAQKNQLSLDTLSTDGEVTLAIDGKYRIRVIPISGGRLILIAKLGRIPREIAGEEQMINKTLGLSYLSAKNAEVYPALDPDQEMLTLQMIIPANIKIWTFEEKLEHFIHHFGIWRDYLNK